MTAPQVVNIFKARLTRHKGRAEKSKVCDPLGAVALCQAHFKGL